MADRATILVIDDHKSVREILREGLEAFGHEVETAGSAAHAREVFVQARFDLVLCDIDMPGESGTELLPWLKDVDPDIAVMMVTGIDDASTAVSAMLMGASDYVCKPFSLPEVKARTEQALEKRRLRIDNRRYQHHLEQLVSERTEKVREAMTEIHALNEDLRSAYDATLSALMIALDYRDDETQGHSMRVVSYTDRLAREMGIEEPLLTEIRRGAMLHDVGKIGIPDAILQKPDRLTDEEREIMRLHPQLGYEILRTISFLAIPAELVLTHQECWDGHGYPSGLKHEEIPVGARIFAVADTFDAMTSDRPYRQSLPFSRVKEELMDYAGVQFDPRVVEAFLRVPEREWLEMRDAVRRLVQSGPGIPQDLLRDIGATSG